MKRSAYLLVSLLLLCGCRAQEDHPTDLDSGLASGGESLHRDEGLADRGILDAELPDAELPDAELSDAELPDAELPDAELPDAELPDAELPDAELPDAELPDAELPDAALPDAELPDAELPPSPCLTDNGGCGPSSLFQCDEGAEAEVTCALRAELISYPEATDSAAVERYRVLILMVNTTGPIPEQSEPEPSGLQAYYSPEELGEVYFNDPKGVRAFIREASYGRVELYGEVLGWLHTPAEDLNNSQMIERRAEFFEYACDVVDCGQYDVFVLNGLVTGQGTNLGWGLGNSLTVTQGHFQNVGFDYMINSSFLTHGDSYSDGLLKPNASWPHELLHTLGVAGHANSLWCSEGETAVALGGVCENKAYGGVFSLMGERAYATHPNFIMKQDLGWLSEADLYTIEVTGDFVSQRVTLYPIELPPTEGRRSGLSVRLPHAVDVAGLGLDRIHLELRAPIGLDDYLLRLDGPEAPDQGSFLSRYTSLTEIDRVGAHVFLDKEYDASDTTWDIDTHPGTAYNPDRGIKWQGNPGRFADAILNVGETLSPSALPDLEVEVLELNEDGGLEVEVRCRGARCGGQTCGVNERVQGGRCVFCPAGMTRVAGDDPTGLDTECAEVPCPQNTIGEHVSTGCRCDYAGGWTGQIAPSRFSPGYEGGCTQ